MTMTGWQDREPELRSGGRHYVSPERRKASRRVHRLNLDLDLELFRGRTAPTDAQRAAAGRRADDLQEQILAVRAEFPDLTLGECQ